VRNGHTAGFAWGLCEPVVSKIRATHAGYLPREFAHVRPPRCIVPTKVATLRGAIATRERHLLALIFLALVSPHIATPHIESRPPIITPTGPASQAASDRPRAAPRASGRDPTPADGATGTPGNDTPDARARRRDRGPRSRPSAAGRLDYVRAWWNACGNVGLGRPTAPRRDKASHSDVDPDNDGVTPPACCRPSSCPFLVVGSALVPRQFHASPTDTLHCDGTGR